MTRSPSPSNPPKALPIRAAAAQIPCCTRTLRKDISLGILPAFRLGPRIFIKAEDFETYVQNRAIPVLPDGLVLATSRQSAVQGEPPTTATPTAATSKEASHG
jgi:hypothetical protein